MPCWVSTGKSRRKYQCCLQGENSLPPQTPRVLLTTNLKLHLRTSGVRRSKQGDIYQNRLPQTERFEPNFDSQEGCPSWANRCRAGEPVLVVGPRIPSPPLPGSCLVNSGLSLLLWANWAIRTGDLPQQAGSGLASCLFVNLRAAPWGGEHQLSRATLAWAKSPREPVHQPSE